MTDLQTSPRAPTKTVVVPDGTDAPVRQRGRQARIPDRRARSLVLTAAVAGGTFWIAVDEGSYSIESRSTVAIVVWWSIVLAIGLGLLPLARPGRTAVVAGGLLAGLVALTGASIAWAPSAERAFVEFNRSALFLGIFALAVLAGTRANATLWADGLALGITAVTVLALGSRCFPDAVPSAPPAFLTEAQARLSYPVGYWNGLAVLSALACPLLLRAAVSAGRPVYRGLAVAPLPAIAAVIYLASSRGGAAAAIVGTATFVALTGRRWPAAGAALLGAAGSAGVLAFLLRRDELVDGPLDSTAAHAAGPRAAGVIAGACLLTGLVYFLAVRLTPRGVRLPAAAGWATAVGVLVLAAGGLAAAEPVSRFEAFKAMPTDVSDEDYVRSHFLSSSGNGRWQLWGTAVDAFETEPVHGRGAGTYEQWWAEHGSLPHFVRDAHSLYAETLAELGIVGLALLGSTFAFVLAVAASRLRRSDPERRVFLAAVTAAFLAFAFAAGFDWMWELTAVAAVGVLCLALVVGPAARPEPDRRPGSQRGVGSAARAAFVAVAVCLAGSQAVSLVSAVRIGESQTAVARGELPTALRAAKDATAVQPWAASAYLQLALVEEHVGELDAGQRAIRRAIERDPADWRLWLVASRIELRRGDVATARASLRRAIALNPRSALWKTVEPG